MRTIYLAGGCFWGIQKYIDQFDGIIETNVGYANGHLLNPTYEEVKAQKSGHAETVKIIYDENVISLSTLLRHFYKVIDPTSLNKQGEDEGESYRVGIYYDNKEDVDTILTITNETAKQYEKPFVIEMLPLQCYFPAEEYHQKYLEKNPQGYCHIDGCYFK